MMSCAGNEWVKTNLTEEDGVSKVMVYQVEGLTTEDIETKVKDVYMNLHNPINLVPLYNESELEEINREIDECR